MRLNQETRRGEAFDVLMILLAVVAIVAVVFGLVMAITHPQKYHPVNAASVAPGQLVYHDREPGIVIAVTQGTAESSPLVRVRFKARGDNGAAIYSEAAFLPGELEEKDISP